jgi:hypothetical protein
VPLIDMFSIMPLAERAVKALESIATDAHRISVNTRHIALNTKAVARKYAPENMYDESLPPTIERVIAR